MTGAPYRDGLAGPEGPEPHAGLGSASGIPSAGQPAPYTCKHGCERDDLKDRLDAATLIEKRLRELSVVICAHLGGGSEWFSRIGEDFYVDPKIIGAELQRRKTDAQITKRALIRANSAKATEA